MSEYLRMEVKGMSRLFKKMKASTESMPLIRGMRRAGIFISGWVKARRLTGPRPKHLGVKTGRLRASIIRGSVYKRGNAYVMPIGTNVKYARIHELGGIIKKPAKTVSVGIHEYKRRGIKFVQAGSKKMTASLTYDTKAHQIKMPARPFLKPGIELKSNQREAIRLILESIKSAQMRA